MVGRNSRAGRVFANRPERVAAAWRRLRCAQFPPSAPPRHLLEDVVEPFIREVGHALEGEPGSPWSRTRATLRLSPSRGPSALHEEFATLRRCLEVSLDVLQASEDERACLDRAMDEAIDGAVALQEALERGEPAESAIPFGGIVLELFEESRLEEDTSKTRSAVVH